MYLIRYALLTAVLCFAAILAACGQSGPSLTDAEAELSWPPNESLSRAASDDVPFFRGKDYASAGGGKIQVSGNGVVLGPHLKPSWAIYSLQGFGPGTEMDKLEIDFTLIPGAPDQGTRLYIGFANYVTETWEWMEEIEPQKDTIDLPDFADYYSPSGAIHVACILAGNGTTRINSLRFYRTGPGAEVPVPANLVANPIPGSIELSWDAIPHVDGYNIYRNTVDDFATASKRQPLPHPDSSYTDSTVVKDTDYFYWVTAVRTVESAPSSGVAAHSIDTTVDVPQNLQGTVGVWSAHLTWDPVPGVIGYKVLRSKYADYSVPTVFQCIDPVYDDIDIFPYDTVYYYQVVGVGVIEDSLPSSGIDLFIPSVDLPAPTNFAVDPARSDGDFVTFTWDYDVDPMQFDIYIHRTPDFALDDQLIVPNILRAGTERSAIRFGLPAEGGVYYARIVARDAEANRGRMTDAISFTNNPYYVFAPQTKLSDEGLSPVAAATDGTMIGAVYSDSGNIRMAYRNGLEVWTKDVDVSLNTGFGSNADIAYGGGSWVIGAQHNVAHDCWASVGTPGGSWSSTRIHGDGSEGNGHAISGFFLAAAASDTEFAVTQLDDTGNAVLVHTRAIASGSWSTATAFGTTLTQTDLSLEFLGGDLHVLMSEPLSMDLLHGMRSNGYADNTINLAPGDGVCGDVDLVQFDGGLYTSAIDLDSPSLHSYSYDGADWSRQDVMTGLGEMQRVSVAERNGKLLITYFNADIVPGGKWMYSYFDGTDWSMSSLVTFPETPVQDVRPVILNSGEPHIVFNIWDGQLFAAPGVFL